MDDSRGATFYQYDAMDRLVQVVEPQGWATSYTYDLAGCRLSLNCAWGTVTYGYDACDRLASMSDPEGATTYAYDKAGRLAQRTNWGDGVETYTYNACGRLTRLEDRHSDTTLLRLDYTYDAAGNRLSMSQVRGGVTRTATYTYDAVCRLAQVSPSASSPVTYTHDAVGNRVKMQDTSGHSYTFSYDSNDRLTSAQGSWPDWPASMTFAYDANGNRTQKLEGTKTTTHLYDAADRLRRITLPDAATVCYNYSGDGRRVYYKDKDQAYYHQYDGEQVVADLDGTGVAVAFYGREPGGRLNYSVQQGLLYRYHQDALGSVVLVTEGGDAVAQYDYDDYGLVTAQWTDPELVNRFKYVGVGLDTGPGLYAMPARYYDPQVGRFLSRDPWGGDDWQPWTRNLYAYARDNPVNYVDPSGMREVRQSRGWETTRVNWTPPFTSAYPITGWFREPRPKTETDPVTGQQVVTRSRPHGGVDLGAPTGTPVRACDKASIVSAGKETPRTTGYGIHVVLRTIGYDVIYAHLLRVASGIEKGSTAARGQVLGLTDNTGRSAGPHLHLEVRPSEGGLDFSKRPPVDPLTMFQLPGQRREGHVSDLEV